jgi:hypothetical protein
MAAAEAASLAAEALARAATELAVLDDRMIDTALAGPMMPQKASLNVQGAGSGVCQPCCLALERTGHMQEAAGADLLEPCAVPLASPGRGAAPSRVGLHSGIDLLCDPTCISSTVTSCMVK